MSPLEGILLLLFAVSLMVFVFFLVQKNQRKGMQIKDADYVKKSISLFQVEVKPLLERLNPPHDCGEGAAGLKQLRGRYGRMQKLANRFPESSQEYQQIFNQALQPVLDKLSYANTGRECFKNPRFKKAFDRFIQVAQKNAKAFHNQRKI